MSRRAAAWLLSVPIIVGGTEAGHWLVYRLVYPNAYMRAQVLAASGHGYLNYWPVFAATLGALALGGFAGRSVAPRGQGGGAVALFPFLALAPLTFALQECTERLATGGWPFSAALEPTFVPGVVLQLPFALITYLMARLLLRAADHLQLRRVAEPQVAYLLVDVHGGMPAAADIPRLREACSGYGVRGPPILLAARA